MLYEWVELEVNDIANKFSRRELTMIQFQHSLEEITKRCSTVLNCLLPIEYPSPFEEMIIKSTKGIKSSTIEVCNNLTGLKS